METSALVWNPSKKARATAVPRSIEEALKGIIHSRYFEDNCTLSELQTFIFIETGTLLEPRQIKYRIDRYGLRKKDRTALQQSCSNPAQEWVANQDVLSPDITTTSFEQPKHSGVLPEERTVNSRKTTASKKEQPCGSLDLPLLSVSAQSKQSDEVSLHRSVSSLDDQMEVDEDSGLLESSEPPTKLSGGHEVPKDGISVETESATDERLGMLSARIPNVLNARYADHYEKNVLISQVVVPIRRGHLKLRPLTKSGKLFYTIFKTKKPVVVRTADGPDISIASPPDIMTAIMGTIYNQFYRIQTKELLDIPPHDLHLIQQLSGVLLCCGWLEQGSWCVELLWKALIHKRLSPAIVEADWQFSQFSRLTSLLSLILEIRWLDTYSTNEHANEWAAHCMPETVAEALVARAEFSARDWFEIYHLAMVARNEPSRYDFYCWLKSFWQVQADLGRIPEQMHDINGVGYSTEHLKEIFNESLGNHLKAPWDSTTFASITHVIEGLLLWVQKLLLPMPKFEEDHNAEELWSRALSYCELECLEKHVLIAFLVYHGSNDLVSWKLRVSENQQVLLPPLLLQEWMSGRTPIRTFGILALLIQGIRSTEHRRVDAFDWAIRRLSGVDRLLNNPEETARQFLVLAASVDNINFKPGAPARRRNRNWCLCNGIDEPHEEPVTSEIFNEMSFNLISRITVFGLGQLQPLEDSDLPKNNSVTTTTSSINSPTLPGQRNSSTSDLNSFKSIIARFKGTTQSWSSSSSYLRRLSSSSSNMDGILGSFIQLSRNSGFSFPTRPLHNGDSQTAATKENDEMKIDS